MRHGVIEHQALRAVKWKWGDQFYLGKHQAGTERERMGDTACGAVGSRWRRLAGSEAGDELGCPGLEPSRVWLFLKGRRVLLGGLMARSR